MPDKVIIVNFPRASGLSKNDEKHYHACYCNGDWDSHLLLCSLYIL